MNAAAPAGGTGSLRIPLVLLLVVLLPPARHLSAQTSPGTDNSATIAAGRQVHDAQVSLDAARVQMIRLRNTVRAQLEGRPEWATVVANEKRAQADFDSARKAAFARLEKDPQYAAIREERQSARQTLATADAADSPVSDAEITKATDLVFSDGLKMKQMENRALEDDAKYAQAKTQLDAARSRLDQLDGEVAAALQSQPEYQQLQQQLDQATQQLAQARQQLAQAAQAERQAREQEAKAREQQSFGR